MKKVLVAAFVLFCGAVLVSQWRAATTAEKTRQIIAHRAGPHPEIEPESLSPREIRSPFKPLPRPRIVSISTNTSPERILVEYGGRWYPAEVVQSDGNRRLIHYTGYGNEWDEWVGPERIRNATETTSVAEATSATAAQRLQPQTGDFVVKWGNRWWRAEPLQQKDDQTLIRYVGYGPEWDEWVTPERAKVFTETDTVVDAVTEKEVAPLSGLDAVEKATARPSAKFLVEWNGQWYPADVLAEQDGKYFIHYEGYGENWDEWIKPERLRVPGQQPQ